VWAAGAWKFAAARRFYRQDLTQLELTVLSPPSLDEHKAPVCGATPLSMPGVPLQFSASFPSGQGKATLSRRRSRSVTEETSVAGNSYSTGFRVHFTDFRFRRRMRKPFVARTANTRTGGMRMTSYRT